MPIAPNGITDITIIGRIQLEKIQVKARYMPNKQSIYPTIASEKNSFSCSARPASLNSTPKSLAISGNTSVSKRVTISSARFGSSSGMFPVTEVSLNPFSRNISEKPIVLSTVTISANGTKLPAFDNSRVRSKKSADISSSGKPTITSDVRVPIGKLAASIPFNLLRNSRPMSSIVNPRAWP